MPVQVASLEAVLDLNKKAFEKDLRETNKNLDKATGSLKQATGQTDKLAGALGDATKKGRLGLSEIDQGASNAKGSLSSMMASLGGGAAAAAESSLNSTASNVDKLGKTADATRAKFGSMTGSLTSRMDKAGKSVKRFGKDADKTMDAFVADLREAAEEVDDLGQAGDKAGDKFGGLADGISDMIPGLDQLKGLAGAGGPLGLIAGAAIAAGTAIVSAGLEAQGIMNNIQARTGATGAELEALGDIAKDVFLSGFGDNAKDAADSVIQVTQVLNQTGDAAVDSAKKALTMRDVFEIDIPESLRAVRSANKQFGDETADTFDMMTTLIQRVGDPFQDLADTINEYSADMAQAGFTQAEFFGILERGVSLGARNFDILADLVREFTIRIIDGSDKTRNALNALFAETGRGGEEYFALETEISRTTDAIEENERALKESEGAYEAQRLVVGELEAQLSEARRELDSLSRPNLRGMEEFDDALFSLDQQAKRLQLALLGLEEDTPAFENTRAQLEEINKEMDRVALERDLTIGAQLREIEKAARDGQEPIVTYEQALANVANQRGKIAELEGAFIAQQEALKPLASEYERIAGENERLITLQDNLAQQLEEMVTPADEFLQMLASGEIATRDAMSAIVKMLGEIENQIVADQLAVDLFGTKAEELGLDIITALDPAINKMTEFEGATDRAAAAMEQGLKPAWDRFWRGVKTTLGETFEFFAEGKFSPGEALSDLGQAITSPFDFRDRVTKGFEGMSFAGGGVVPGPIGQPVPAVVHGGERILTPDQQAAGGITIVVQGNIFGDSHLREVVDDGFRQLNMVLAGAN
jgi:phage-related minor tail protein